MALVVIEIEELERILKKILPEICRQQIRDAVQHHIPNTEKLLDRKQAANFLNVSLPTLDRYILDGKVPAYKISRGAVRFKQRELVESLGKVTKYQRKKIDEG